MATRSCLRCCKLVPETASFCRRCGLSMWDHGVARGFSPHVSSVEMSPELPSTELPSAGRGPRFIVVAVLAMWAAVKLFTASIPPATSCYDWGGKPPAELSDDPAVDDARLARVREQLASATERIAAARQRLSAARQRFEGRHELGPGWSSSEEPETAPWLFNKTRRTRERNPENERNGPPALTPAWSAPEPSVGPTTIDALARANVLRPDAPRIDGFSRVRAPAGVRIAIDGRGFRGASHVLFAAAGATGKGWRDADFRVRDDGRLLVTVPDLGPGELRPTIVVVTPAGAAITTSSNTSLVSPDAADRAPDSDAGLFFVTAGATLSPRYGAAVIVERGASVHAASGSLVVVRSGGGVERARTDCLIIRETPRPEARDLAVTPVLDVPAVNTCFLDSPFQYSGR